MEAKDRLERRYSQDAGVADKAMKLLVTVAARKDSKGLKDKNIRELAGKPLIAYTIEQIIKWGKFDKFIVSTDSPRIAKIAMHYGAEVPFLRPAELATDKIGKCAVLRHALIEAEKIYNRRFDALFDLDATAPIRSVEDIDNIVNLFKKKKAACVFSVVTSRRNPYFNMVEKRRDGSVKVCKKPRPAISRRQDVPIAYDMNASMYVYNRDFLMDRKNRLPYSKKAYVYVMDETSAIDIDSELDFKFIEFLIKEGRVRI